MAYDGFYSELSTRGSTNEILNLAIQTKEEIEVLVDQAQVSADEAAAAGSAAGSAAGEAAAEAVLSSKVNTVDLSDASDPNKGSGMVGFYDSTAPAFLKTISDIINMEPVNILRLVPKSLWTDLHNGTGTFPLAASLNELISDMSAVGGGEIMLTHGKHMIENYIEMLSNVTLSGMGDNSVIRGMFASPVNRMLTSPAAVLQYNIYLRRFKLDRSVVNTQHGIILGGIDGLTIDDVTVDGFGPGVTSGAMGISPFDAFAAVQSRNVIVKNCKINTPNNFGIAFGNVSGGSITKNLFTNAFREAIGLECWGNTSAVEDVVVSDNILRMDTQASNHVGGSIGPGILVGGAGASYGGVTRRCTVEGNIITVNNPAGVLDFSGIVVVGGTSAPYAAEDILIEGNTVFNAPAKGISVGSLGAVQRRVVSRNNTILNPNTSNNGYPAIYLRAGTDCTFQGDVVVGSLHSYAVYEDTGAIGNTFLDIVPGNPVTGTFFRNPAGTTTLYRDATTNQVVGGHEFQENRTINNNASATYTARTNPNRGIYMLVTSSGAYAILAVNGATVPVVIAKSIDVVVGATDPGTASAFNVYPASTSAIAVTNRIGAAHNVTLKSLNAN